MARQKNPMRQSWLGDGQTEGWVASRIELKVSPSWRHRPVPLIHLLERLEIEHIRHGGAENGALIVTYDQLVEHGVSRRTIRGSLALGEALGLLEVRQSGEWTGDVIRSPNTYRLTYLPEKGRRAPTDEWETVDNDAAVIAVAKYQMAMGRKPTDQCHKVQSASAISCTETSSASATNDKSPVPEVELLYIYGGNPAANAEPVQDGEEATPPKGRAPRTVQASGSIDNDKPRSDLGDAERSLLRWMITFRGPATHRTAQQNLSGILKGEVISAAAQSLADRGLMAIEVSGKSRTYRLLEDGYDPALLRDPNQTDLIHWLEGAVH